MIRLEALRAFVEVAECGNIRDAAEKLCRTPSALSMTLDGQRLPAVYGVLTPAVAMGDVLLQRLQAAGMVFEVLTEETSQA